MASIKTCVECGKKMYNLQSSKLCGKCYQQKRFQEKGRTEEEKEKNREYSRKYAISKDHNISYEEYVETTKKCILCKFDKVIQLHHIDGNHKNNSKKNLVGLCPNHHRMIHHRYYKENIIAELRLALCTQIHL